MLGKNLERAYIGQKRTVLFLVENGLIFDHFWPQSFKRFIFLTEDIRPKCSLDGY